MTLQDTTLAQMCATALARDPLQPALEFADTWVTWGELRRLADRVAALVHESGVGGSAPVVFVPRSRPSAVAAFLALLAQARTVRMVYAFQSPVGIARDVDRLEPELVIVAAEDFAPEVRDTLQASGAAVILLSELDAQLAPGLERFGGRSQELQAAPEVQILTSGTTGPPKRFGMTHDMVARHVVGANKNYQGALVDYTREPPAFLYYPLGNISGISGLLPTLLRGHRAVLVERFSVDNWRNYLRRHRPERTSLPPAGFQMVLDANVPVEELQGVRAVATGAAPLEASVHRAFVQRFGIPVLLTYGATEFGGPVCSMTLELHAEWGEAKLGSVGKPIAGAQLRVIDPETGAVLPAGQEGLLEVIAPRVGPSWIRTSDLALIDADGFMFHRGRADGAIMRGGFKLLPETIERALLQHASVSAACVVGVPEPRLGQVPVAAVQLKLGSLQPSAAELEQHLRDLVYATHIPVAWRFVAELPRTASFKVDTAAVRSLFS
ncbi:MAG TPA: fatty acid--CoA ligase family protein [Polyangiales bacterium]|nr:fatty acid--CoA ligase family protein [Polyangiales bacterium]